MSSKSPAEMRVYYFPEDILTRAALSPKALVSRAYGTISMHDLDAISTAYSIAAHDPGSSASGVSDVRWGVVFSDGEGREVRSFFFEASGRGGYTAGRHSQFGGKLLRWLRKMCPLFDR